MKIGETPREAQRGLRTILDSAGDGVLLHDGETCRLALCNKSCARMLGYSQEEFIRLSVADIHPEEDLPFIYAQIEELLKGGNLVRSDMRFKRKDGSILLADVSSDLVLLNGRRHVLVALKDIAESKRMGERQDRVEQSLQFTQFAVDHTADAAFWMTEDGGLFYVNEAACRALGYSRDELLRMTVYDIDPAFTESMWRESWCRLKSEKSIILETVHRARDGRIYPVEIRANYLEFGGRAYDCAFARDITERKQAQEALAESRRKYRGLVEKINDWVWETDADGVYTYSSPRALDVLGYAPEEIVGKTPFDFMLPGEAQRVRNVVEPTWLERKPLELLENTLVRKDGSLVIVETSGMPVFAEDGSFLGYTGIDRDVTSRERAEEALRESEERHRRLLDNLKGSHFIYTHDTQGVFQYLSDSIADVLGYTPEEFMTHYGKYLTDHPANQAVREHTELTLQGIRQPPYEVNSWHKDGSTRWLEVQELPVFDAKGQVIAVEGVAQDITERKLAEEALREKEHLLSESQRIGHIGTWSADLATDAATWTRETYRLFGVSPETFVPSADTLIALLHPDDRGAMREWIRAMWAGEQADVLEFRVVLPGGSTRMLSGRAEMIVGDDGRPVRLVGTVQDVTEQKQVQAALVESEERYRILLEHGFDGVFVQEDFRIVQLNDRLAEMAGCTRADLKGKEFVDMLTPDSQERIRHYVRSGAGGYIELELRRCDGRVIAVESYGAACRFQGRDARIVGLRDITERKGAEETLRSVNEQLEVQVAQRTEDLCHMVDRLRQLTLELSQAEDRERRRIADILHEDVQQTLAAARFHLNLLAGGTCGAEESRRVVELVRQMLRDAIDRSRNLSHELSPALYQVELIEILSWLARHMEREHGLAVRVQVHGRVDSPSEPLKAFLYKVTQELLFNVVKHAGVQEATVRVRRTGRNICLSVVDRGRGFDAVRLEEATGFGLLSIRERVRLLGGRMKIRSTPGVGSRFLIVVPDPEASRAADNRSDASHAVLQREI